MATPLNNDFLSTRLIGLSSRMADLLPVKGIPELHPPSQPKSPKTLQIIHPLPTIPHLLFPSTTCTLNYLAP